VSTTQLPIDATRSTLHAAARRVFARQGVHAATMTEIAAEAHLSLDTLHRYYATEDDLLRDIISEWVTQTPPETGQTATPSIPLPPPNHAIHVPNTGGERQRAGAPSVAPAPASVLPKQGQVVADNRTLAANASQLAVLNVSPHIRSAGIPIGEIVRSAIGSLAANKMRSVLTMLGIIIGVGSVVGLLAIGNGVSGFIRDQIEGNGANTITVQGSKTVVNNVPTGGRYQSLTLEDAQALAAPGAVPHSAATSPEVQTQTTITAGNAVSYSAVLGVWPDYLIAHHAKIQQGDFVMDEDVARTAKVVVLGPTLAKDLFGDAEPIGEMVHINNESFRVVGVLAPKSGGPPGGGFLSPDSQAYVPLTTALASLVGNNGTSGPKDGATVRRGRVISTIAVEAEQGHILDAKAEVQAALDARHGTNNDYELSSNESLLNTVSTTVTLIQAFLVVVAGISLLVGGIGIMNIMLVSVTERTREIGIRKAIGAREGTILTQFLTESVFISLAGAIIGVLFGLMMALLATIFWRPCNVSVTSILVAVLFSMGIGLFFGVYPARRAAALKPIDALRYE